jgi:hypothetical protein
MHRRYLISLLIAAMLSSLACCAAPLPDDPALGKPATLAVKGEALSDVLKTLTDQTGVQLKVSGEIADQKVTIFVDAKPLRDLMTGLATLFQYEWSKSASGGHDVYTVSEPSQVRKAREEAYRQATAAEWAKIEAEIGRDAQMKPDQAATQAAIEAFRSKIAGDRSVMQQEYDKLKVAHDAVSNALTGKIAVAQLYRSLPPKAIQAIRDDCFVCCDTQSAEPEWTLSADVVQSLQPFLQLRKIMELAESDPKADLNAHFSQPDGIGFILQSCENPGSSQLSAWFYPRFSKRNSNGFEINYNIDIDSADLGAAVSPSQAETVLPNRKEDPVLDRKVTINMSECAAEAQIPRQAGGSASVYANRSDILALLHSKLGLQVISDYYSRWFDVIGLYSKDRSLRDVLTQLSNRVGGTSGCKCEKADTSEWGWDGQVLYSRERDSDYWDRGEVPNQLLTAWRAVYKKQGYLGIDTFAEMACLPDDQTETLAFKSVFLGFADDDRYGNSSYYYPESRQLIKLYASLTAQQRQKALASQLENADLTSDQQAELVGMVISSLHESDKIKVGIYHPMTRRVDKPQPDAPPQGVSLSLRVETDQVEPDTDSYYYCEDTTAIERALDPLDAITPDAALKEARKDHPTATMASIARSRDYRFSFDIRCTGANYDHQDVINRGVLVPGALAMCGSASATGPAPPK